MEFINFEADKENPENCSLNVSDEDENESNFMNDSEEITNDVSCYRSLDHNNVEHNKFPNQTRKSYYWCLRRQKDVFWRRRYTTWILYSWR